MNKSLAFCSDGTLLTFNEKAAINNLKVADIRLRNAIVLSNCMVDEFVALSSNALVVHINFNGVKLSVIKSEVVEKVPYPNDVLCKSHQCVSISVSSESSNFAFKLSKACNDAVLAKP